MCFFHVSTSYTEIIKTFLYSLGAQVLQETANKEVSMIRHYRPQSRSISRYNVTAGEVVSVALEDQAKLPKGCNPQPGS